MINNSNYGWIAEFKSFSMPCETFWKPKLKCNDMRKLGQQGTGVCALHLKCTGCIWFQQAVKRWLLQRMRIHLPWHLLVYLRDSLVWPQIQGTGLEVNQSERWWWVGSREGTTGKHEREKPVVQHRRLLCGIGSGNLGLSGHRSSHLERRRTGWRLLPICYRISLQNRWIEWVAMTQTLGMLVIH